MQCVTPMYLAKNDICVPCGRCAFCLATRRSDWATRLHFESKLHLDSSFVTLTYADCHLTWKSGSSQLVKVDLQRFFKRLRKAGFSFRYYAVGEYGSRTYRPHYHVLFFGCVPEKAIEKAWYQGQIHYGTVTQQSVMYCLGYIVNGRSYKMRNNRVPPFSVMSRKPGLGSNYLTPEMVRWHHGNGSYTDYKNHVIVDGARRHLPRFYKSKIFSKIDCVRIAVQVSKAMFKKDVDWIRSPSMRNHSDPFRYRSDQLQALAQSIKSKSKENLVI